ncbi:hypothetical protein EPA93_13830 [Ktedonosporobacter rubrisoli]|uniref:YtkA-like domain-containing protein n=1 Tax=Ktedonosporobacter rubrisoli TaxID=2509675 RepID=A0A4P6JQI6_KTERU|nr:hypothetical protein [Ktedonosporobacter rubrisoli]QBD77026.1 hypothetical protein EPA93_13830 [Ktedonosporobacter rubrisoli]
MSVVKHSRYLASLLIVCMALLGLPGTALAHGGPTNGPQTYTQTVGPYEIATEVEPTMRVPGPLNLKITAHTDIKDGVLSLRAAPSNLPFTDSNRARVRLIAGQPGPYYVQLHVQEGGMWELELCLQNTPKKACSLIPFTVIAPTPDAASLLVYGAFAFLGLILAASVVAGLVCSWLHISMPRPFIYAFGLLAIISLTAALTIAAQQAFMPAPTIQLSSATTSQAGTPSQLSIGRPYVNVELVSMPAKPIAGQALTLDIQLTDGSTGLPIDDLVLNHDALMHLVIINEDGSFFRHLHPARLAPGHFQISFIPDQPGQYSVYAEIERLNSGDQLIMHTLEVGGHFSPSTPAVRTGLGMHNVADLQIQISASHTPILSGEPITLTFHITRNGRPVTDIQPWLGMAGHLLMRSNDGMLFAHVHAVGAMPGAPGPVSSSPADWLNGTGAGDTTWPQNTQYFGPDVQFVYTFPEPGTYQGWMQFQHAHQIITVPFQLQVSAQ